MWKTILVCISLGLMFGFWWGVSVDQPGQPEKLPTKVIRVADSSSTRYFFIAYSIGQNRMGNITWVAMSGRIPTNAQLIDDILLDNNGGAAFNKKDFMITGLYEFKNEAEFNRFYDLNQ
jgi:hypothetical protein